MYACILALLVLSIEPRVTCGAGVSRFCLYICPVDGIQSQSRVGTPMSIPAIEILTPVEVRGFAAELVRDVRLHDWEPERLIKAFAYKLHPRWFYQEHLYDLFPVVGLAKDDWRGPFQSLVENKLLISDSPANYLYDSLDGRTYQVMYCYRLQRAAHAAYERDIAAMLPDPPPIEPAVTEVLLPSLVAKAPGYIQEIVRQANGCYEYRWFDACSVMIRKLIENLIIAVYEYQQRVPYIQGSDGNFVMLGALIDRLLADASLNLGRETKTCLPLVKSLGDRAAHNRHFMAKKPDVDKVIQNLRVTVPELLLLAGVKP